MNRPTAQPNNNQRLPRQGIVDPRKFELNTISASSLSQGMITYVDTADIPNEAVVYAANCVIRRDRTSRRPGTVLHTPTKPNSNPVLDYVSVQHFDNTIDLVRFDTEEIWLHGAVAWVEITGAGLTCTLAQRPLVISTNDRTFFTTDGLLPIQEIDFATPDYGDLGNAPRAKYFCSFFNKLVAANIVEISLGVNNPILVQWSGDLNFAEWDPSVDISAGNTPLIESQSDYDDFITGIFGFATVMITLRERSIWGATKQPDFSQPFYFYTAVPNVGCDTPNSAVQIDNGIAFYDRRTGMAYAYTIGDTAPQPIGLLVKDDIASCVTDPTLVFASYNAVEKEYILACPIASTNLTRLWVYNFITKAWCFRDYVNLTSVNNLNFSGSTPSIDDLIGNIEDLTGTIGDLGGEITTLPTMFGGYLTGEIVLPDETVDEDVVGGAFETDIISKTYVNSPDDICISFLTFDYACSLDGEIQVLYSTDDGITWKVYKTIVASASLKGRTLIRVSKNIRTRQFTWRLLSTSGIWDILNYTVNFYPGSDSRK